MKKRHSAEQIVAGPRQADVELAKAPEGSRGVQTTGGKQADLLQMGTKYGRMDPRMAGQLRDTEKQNIRLKKLVADQALDNQILRCGSGIIHKLRG